MTDAPSQAVEQATEAVGRRLLALDRLLAYLDATASRLRHNGDDESLHEMVDAQSKALRWALRIVRPHVDTEIQATVEREARRKKWGVHHLPAAEPLDPDHARALAHLRGLRVELEKMEITVPGRASSLHLGKVYGRFCDAVLAAIEEHAVGYYQEQSAEPPRMVLRSDGAIIMDTRRPIAPAALTGECPSCGEDRPLALSGMVFAPGSVCPRCGHVEPESHGD